MMQKRLFLGILACVCGVVIGCAESAVQPEIERDSEADPVFADPDAGSESPGADPNEGSVGRMDAGTRQDSGSTSAPPSDAGLARDSGPVVTDASSVRLDGGARDAGTPVADAGRPVTTPADAGRPGVVDAGAPGCGESLISCGGQCVDLKTSNQNCGACGTLCNDGSSCSNSKCNPPVTVPNGCTAKMFEGKTYAFCTRARTWNDARRACINADMELALVTSGDESDFIKANGDSWIAANDLDKEGAWVSPVLGALNNNNGPVLTYTRWNAGEPSNSQRCGGVDIFVGCIGARTDEDCGLVLGASGNWNDADCNTERNYVCEPF